MVSMSAPIKADRIARYLERIEAERDTMEELAVRIAEGESLKAICATWNIPLGRFAGWIASDPRRQDIYDGAKRLRADAVADELIAIADDGGADVAHAALRSKVRQWAASKWDRGRYGDSVVVQHQGETVVRLTFGGTAQATAQVPSITVVGQSSIAPATLTDDDVI